MVRRESTLGCVADVLERSAYKVAPATRGLTLDACFFKIQPNFRFIYSSINRSHSSITAVLRPTVDDTYANGEERSSCAHTGTLAGGRNRRTTQRANASEPPIGWTIPRKC